MYDAIVVGGGLFGLSITAALRSVGMNVACLDAGNKNSGSRASASLMNPEWFRPFYAPEMYNASLQLLDQLFGVRDTEFQLGKHRRPVTVHGLDYAVMNRRVKTQRARVTQFTRTRRGWLVTTAANELEGRKLVLAAGVWTGELIEIPGLVGRAGTAFRFPRRQIEHPFIRLWAPYKQVVAFNERPNMVWAGDGTSILESNWTREREDASLTRCLKETGFPKRARVQRVHGIRPYVRNGKETYVLEERQPGLWIATGGAKFGALLAGWCAHTLQQRLS